MAPDFANGKICYVEIPATDIARSADFYAKVFGWDVRTRDDGSTAFEDTVGQVSGSWVIGRPPHTNIGLMLYIMVDDIEATMVAVAEKGCEIVQGVGGDPGETTARFRDPGGNILGIYQEPALRKT